MPEVRETRVVPGAGRRLASVSVSLKGGEAGVLLREGEGKPRGFWGRAGRWFAHLGEAARVEVSSEPGDAGRFRGVWQRGRELLADSWRPSSGDVGVPSPRLFGGFSFRDDHEASGLWEGFPSACFLLPEWELMGEGGAVVLTLRRLLSPEEDPGRVEEELRSRLLTFRERLRVSSGEERKGEPWIPPNRSHPSRGAWTETVRRATAAVSAGDLSKVVLARVQSVESQGPIDPVDVVLNLWRESEGTHVFLFEPVPGRVLVGAAPETLAARTGGVFRATAVAGSTGKGGSDEETRSLARALLDSAKDLTEHRICVEDAVSRLRRLSEEVFAQDAPHVLTLPSIQHLETAVEARLRPGVTVLEALETLHPTPAVCGLPRDRALEFLREEEGFQRGWYAGPVGWFDGEGDGVFVPALRSAVRCGDAWHLFAGAGIVEGSDPDREWEETRVKLQPMLQALGAAGREE
jgi:menaquinone-specific isochorismate synthase